MKGVALNIKASKASLCNKSIKQAKSKANTKANFVFLAKLGCKKGYQTKS